jgi:hypothetical protein
VKRCVCVCAPTPSRRAASERSWRELRDGGGRGEAGQWLICRGRTRGYGIGKCIGIVPHYYYTRGREKKRRSEF